MSPGNRSGAQTRGVDDDGCITGISSRERCWIDGDCEVEGSGEVAVLRADGEVIREILPDRKQRGCRCARLSTISQKGSVVRTQQIAGLPIHHSYLDVVIRLSGDAGKASDAGTVLEKNITPANNVGLRVIKSPEVGTVLDGSVIYINSTRTKIV